MFHYGYNLLCFERPIVIILHTLYVYHNQFLVQSYMVSDIPTQYL